MSTDWKKLGFSKDLIGFLAEAEKETEEKRKERYGEPINPVEKMLFENLARACLTSNLVTQTQVREKYAEAFSQGKHTVLFKGILPSRKPSRFNREFNEAYKILKKKIDDDHMSKTDKDKKETKETKETKIIDSDGLQLEA